MDKLSTLYKKLSYPFISRLNARYNNKTPLVVDLYIGTPGSGKSTIASALVTKDVKHGNTNVYSNYPIAGAKILNPKKDLGYFNVSGSKDKKCRVILDEIGTDFNNRNFKTNISDDLMMWLKRHRHYYVHIDCFSQGLDFDNRFLGLARRVYIVRKFGFVIAAINVRKKLIVDKETHQFVDGYFMNIFKSKFYFAPLYWSKFDSHETTPLPDKNWEYW